MRPDCLTPLFAPITALNGVGPKIAKLIARVAGERVVDMVFTPPISVVDRSKEALIMDAPIGVISTLKVEVKKHTAPPRASRAPYRVLCGDESGFLTLVFFRARADYLQSVLPVGEMRFISGKVEAFDGGRQMTHPDYIVAPDARDELPTYEPVYPLTAGLTSNVMRKASAQALARVSALPEWQDDAWLKARKWSPWHESLQALHTPTSIEDFSALTPPRMRLAYDELLANQLALALTRQTQKKAKGRVSAATHKLTKPLIDALPFSLTNDQRAALKIIKEDMAAPTKMVRLVQGDVGSGKTIVALLSMAIAVENGAQAVLMAPTEILANQHLDGLAPLSEMAGINLEVLSGKDKGKKREEKLARLARGEIDILIGTHAVFQDDVVFKDLALVVIDEQHRFGVHQRLALSAKGPLTDLLVMTATPIPRTLALTTYGDMEVTQIREKPPGRQPIDTRVIPRDKISSVYEGLRRAIGNGDQVYWVCPLVEESEKLDLTAAQERFEALSDLFGTRAAMVHGRMKAAEKDEVMRRFASGEADILVATTVIEVGVNVPNATIMVIEHAERFGLAQLHQLRGRVGRGDKKSACLLLYATPIGETAKARLEMMRRSEDGFEIAEEDLRLRGAGDMLGAAQSGFPEFKIADVAVHGELLKAARDDATLIVGKDPDLTTPRGEALRTMLYLHGRDDAIKLLQAG